MDTIHTNGTTPATTTPTKRGPGRPRKDGSTSQASTTTKKTRTTKDSVVRRFMNNSLIREFLLLPEDVQNSIRSLVRFEDTSSVEFDLD